MASDVPLTPLPTICAVVAQDFEQEGAQPLKLAGIGGMSEFLGWTDVQRAQARKEGLSYRLRLFARLVRACFAADWSPHAKTAAAASMKL
eukprot:SM000011S19003  [mRNA]  locus=s11:250894:251346:- [translate_table: standard]